MRSLAVILGVFLFSRTTFASDGDAFGLDRALIVVGLPGDSSHEALFKTTALRWKAWLIGPLGFPVEGVRILSGTREARGFGDAPATRESIAREVQAIRNQSHPGRRVWVFVLGHANLDDGHAFLHLPGPDLRDDEFAALFVGLAAKEQVFWLTQPTSGAFLRPLSRPGRIVIAATEPSGEANETEFPHALAEVVAGPVTKLDLDRDGKVSVREVYVATVAAVEARFRSDRRAPTEHARLDDDGDGVGTELQAEPKPTGADGELAARTELFRPPSRTQNGTDRVVKPAR